MKGLMVTLLTFWMTGIVVGQQTNNDQFPIVDRSARTGNNFSPQPEIGADWVKPFELFLSAEKLQGLPEPNGELWSKIEAYDKKNKRSLPLKLVSGIHLAHESAAGKTRGDHQIFGTDVGNGAIRFDLNDLDLKQIGEGRRLVYKFSEAELGKFNQVFFFYKGARQRQQSNQPTNDFSTRTPSGPTPDNSPRIAGNLRKTSPFASPFILPPGPEYEPGDVKFVGPVPPNRDQQIARNNRRTDWNETSRGPTNPDLNPRRNLDTSFPTMQENGFGAVDIRELRRRQLVEDDKKRAARQQSERLAQLNPRPASPWTTPTPTTRRELDNLTQPQYEEWKRRQELDQKESELNSQAQYLANQKAEIDRMRHQFAAKQLRNSQDRLRTFNNDDFAPSSQYVQPTGPVQGMDVPPRQPVIENILGARYASTDPKRFDSGQDLVRRQNAGRGLRGVSDFTASISPPNTLSESTDAKTLIDKAATELKKDRRAEGFIYFLLLCSLGLNVYLMLISRGFYVRYNELADELRETFTATM